MAHRAVPSADTDPEGLRLQRSMVGCLLGTAVGDALGLSVEALSRRRQHRLYPKIEGHRFVFGHGMISDDTEHSCMAAQALIVSAGDPAIFARSFAWKLRWWLLSFPPAIGFATLRALIKLWLGFAPKRSGVFSAGNGPAMRSAILGVAYGYDLNRLRKLVRASTRITHTDPKAEWAALAIAWAAHAASSAHCVEASDFLSGLRAALGEDAAAAGELLNLLERAAASAFRGETSESFANSLGLEAGVSGYGYHTVPVVIQAWLRRPEDCSVALEVIRCGGDTDAVASILGGLVGAVKDLRKCASSGPRRLRYRWLRGLFLCGASCLRELYWCTHCADCCRRIEGPEFQRSVAGCNRWCRENRPFYLFPASRLWYSLASN